MATSNPDAENLGLFGVDNSCFGTFYCHSCGEDFLDCTPDFTCTKCNSSFIEGISSSDQHENAEDGDDNLSIAISHNPMSVPRPTRQGVRRTRISIHHAHRPGSEHENFIQGFINHFLNGLMGNNENQSGPINIQVSPFSINFDEFFLNRDGLDNIITMFMNQMEHMGPAPASKEDIKSLPTVPVTQEHVDNKVQCHVCMEDFILDEEVTRLPCNHIYHTGCIVPWLELHATCPICRMTIGSNTTNDRAQQSHQSSTSNPASSRRTASQMNEGSAQVRVVDDINLD